ncbi:MAG: hypothetical protein AABY51_09570 [Deltaproteobacteria bacterium]
MANKIQIRRGQFAGLVQLDSGEPAVTTDTGQVYVGGSNGNIELRTAPPSNAITVYVATNTLGGRSVATQGATGLQLATGTNTSTGTNKLINSGAAFTTELAGRTVYNATNDTWAKVTAVDSTTQLSLDANIFTGTGKTYVVCDAIDNIPEGFSRLPEGFRASLTLRVSPGAFSNNIYFIGKNAGDNCTLTWQGSTTGTTTVSGVVDCRQRMSWKNITFTGRVYARYGADITWTACVTSGGSKLYVYSGTANRIETSTVAVGNDPQNITNINSTITTGYTMYVASATLGGNDAIADGLSLASGTATATLSGKLVDSAANFSTDVVGKPVCNVTRDLWAKVTAMDSATQLTLDTNLMASGEAYVISNAFATIQKAIDAIPGTVNCNTAIKASGETYTSKFVIQGKAYSGNFNITAEGSMVVLFSGTSTGGSVNYSMGGTGAGAIQATLVDTSYGWYPNTYQNMLLVITGGTGAGQSRVIDSHTDVVIKIAGFWDTVPDATTTYEIRGWATKIDLSGIAASNPQNAIELIGQQGVFLKKLWVADWPCTTANNAYYGLYAHDFSSVNINDCFFSRTRTDAASDSSIQIESYTALGECKRLICQEITAGSLTRHIRFQCASSPKQNNTMENSKFQGSGTPIVIAAGSFVNGYGTATLNGIVIRGARSFGIDVSSFSRFDIGASIITGSATYNIWVRYFGYMNLRSNSEVSGAGSDGIRLDGHSEIYSIGSGNQANNNGGWGLTAINLSYGIFASTLSYTGNTSGTYTADASSKNT